MSGSSLPIARVPRFVGGIHRLKKARGFSLGELQQAGLQQSKARSLGIRTDERRSTAHSQNVAALKTYLGTLTPKTGAPQPAVEAPVEAPETKKKPVSREKKVKPRRGKRAAKRKK